MNKASKWAEEYKRLRAPVFKCDQTTGIQVAHVAENGCLEFSDPGLWPRGSNYRMLPADAVDFGHWLIDMFEEHS